MDVTASQMTKEGFWRMCRIPESEPAVRLLESSTGNADRRLNGNAYQIWLQIYQRLALRCIGALRFWVQSLAGIGGWPCVTLCQGIAARARVNRSCVDVVYAKRVGRDVVGRFT